MQCEPGFFQEVVDSLGSFEDRHRDVNLVVDGMSIKKSVRLDPALGKFVGYTDYGNCIPLENRKEATEALFFMFACINGSWKLPVGYVLADKVKAKLQAELIKTALHLGYLQGIRVRSLTFDGLKTNFSCLRYSSLSTALLSMYNQL